MNHMRTSETPEGWEIRGSKEKEKELTVWQIIPKNKALEPAHTDAVEHCDHADSPACLPTL